ncbi:MAG: IclR family transcriptional regulator [Pikeienuella sp.]
MIESAPAPLTLTAIAERLYKPTQLIFRILKTLEAKGFIRRAGETKEYAPAPERDRLSLARLLARAQQALADQPAQTAGRLAARIGADPLSAGQILHLLHETRLADCSDDGKWSLSPGQATPAQSRSIAEIVEAARPVMERLRAETGETVALFVRNGVLQIALHVLTSPQPLRYAVEVGAVFPINRGAAGKASLAWLAADEILAILNDPSLSGETIDAPALLTELRATRERGYAISVGERIDGAAAVSVPVTSSGDARCAIVVTGPETRFSTETMKAHGAALRATLFAAGLFQEQTSSEAARNRRDRT